MKLALASDLHLEFRSLELKNTENADVLILSGDIAIANDLHDYPVDEKIVDEGFLLPRQLQAIKYRKFFENCSKEFKHIVYVAGNHEFYNGRWNESIQWLRDETKRYTNIHFLEMDTVKIDDVHFIGATIWTDCNKCDPLTLHGLSSMMNDFRVVRNDNHGYRRLTPDDTVVRHKRTLEYFKKVLENLKDENVVIVGHHAPSKLSIHPKYLNDEIMNGGYHSDLSEFILDHPQIKVWTHGHVHDQFEYMIGDTRVVCNPRGYVGYEPNADNFTLKYLDI